MSMLELRSSFILDLVVEDVGRGEAWLEEVTACVVVEVAGMDAAAVVAAVAVVVVAFAALLSVACLLLIVHIFWSFLVSGILFICEC